MSIDLCPEVLEDIANRHTRRLPQAAVGKLGQVCTQHLQVIQITGNGNSLGYAGQDLVSALVADSAGCAFATAFVTEEIEQHSCLLLQDNLFLSLPCRSTPPSSKCDHLGPLTER